MSSSRKALVPVLVFWLCGVSFILASAHLRDEEYRSGEDARESQIQSMADRIGEEDLSEILVDADALPVSGEEDLPDETVQSSEPDASPADGASDIAGRPSGNTYSLRSYGTISIPSIGCELPLWDGAGTVELRYGAGRMPLSCEAGKPGNLIIFGHRMRRYGSIFNRLGEVAIGDSILIVRNGSTFTYTVDQIETIDPSELSRYMDMEKEGDHGSCRITLITCTPTGVGSHRLVIIGHLI